MTHHPHDHIDAVLSRAEVGALLTLGIYLMAVICVAACAVPVLDAVRRWVR